MRSAHVADLLTFGLRENHFNAGTILNRLKHRFVWKRSCETHLWFLRDRHTVQNCSVSGLTREWFQTASHKSHPEACRALNPTVLSPYNHNPNPQISTIHPEPKSTNPWPKFWSRRTYKTANLNSWTLNSPRKHNNYLKTLGAEITRPGGRSEWRASSSLKKHLWSCLQKSIPAKIRQLVLYHSNNEG